MLTAKMAALQERIPAEEALFLSITVDPEYDTAEILKEYAKQFESDSSRWFFLTGPQDQVRSAIEQFQQTYELVEDSEESPNIMHSEKFVLLDQFGEIRGFFDDDPQELNQLIKSLDAL